MTVGRLPPTSLDRMEPEPGFVEAVIPRLASHAMVMCAHCRFPRCRSDQTKGSKSIPWRSDEGELLGAIVFSCVPGPRQPSHRSLCATVTRLDLPDERREHRNHIRACSPPGVTQQVDTSVLFMQRHNEFRSAGCLQSEAEYHTRSTKPTAAPRGKTRAALRT
jgi:hypothetical protein